MKRGGETCPSQGDVMIYQKDWKDRVKRMNWFPTKSPMEKFIENLKEISVKIFYGSMVIAVVLLALYLLIPDTPYFGYGYERVHYWLG